jgi:hypothetical protein
MEKETLKKIFTFLEGNEGRKTPFVWKLENNIPITEKDDLIVGGYLDLSYSLIDSLPEGLKVGESLSLFHCAIITSLPEGLKVGRNLDLDDTNITSLPKGLEIGRNLYIVNTTLAKLSDEELREMVKPGFIKGKIIR